MKSATARCLDSSKHAIADQNERQKINSDASIISQHTGTKNQKISGNNTKRRGIHRRKQTSRYPAMSTLEIPLIAAEHGYTQPEVVLRCTGMQSAIQDSNNLKWEVNDVSSAMNSEVCNFWERRDMESDRKKRNKNKHRLKDSSFHLVAFTASTSVTEEYANAVASDSEPDVISLSDKEGMENREAGTEFALFEQGDDFDKQLQTSPLIKKEVPKCLTASEELERRRVLDNAISAKIDIVNVLETEGIAAKKIDDCNRFNGTVEQLSGLNQSIKLIRTASSNLTARNKEQMKVDRNVCREKKHLATEIPLRDGPLFIRKGSFDELNLVPGTHKFVQNGKVELKIDKPQGKDFIQVILFECCGPLEDPKQVARSGYKICASAVLHENTSIEVMRQALIDLAEELEQISRDSFYPGEKLPYPVNKYSLSYLKKQYIYPLKKKSLRFPRAIYYCGLCQYHICSVPQAVTHFLSREHIDNREKEDSLKKLECLPTPASEQMSKIDQIIQELYVSAKLSDIQYEVGSQIANFLTHLLQNEACKNFSVMVYGSYVTRLATIHSNLNLALNFPQEYSLGHALSRVMEVLNNIAFEKDFIVHSITSDFQRPDPSVHCIVNSVAVVITTNCIRQQRATQLINLYCTICSQFRILATVFHSWAELCSLNNVQLGGLPKFAFDIILIYYLQHKGLLPFIFEILSEEEILLLDSESLQFEHQVDRINTSFGTDNEEWNYGEIWIGLFRYYAIEHPIEELIQIRWRKRYLAEDYMRWNKKRLAVEDPFASDHIMQPQQRINSYFSSCFLSTYIYFALPRTMVCSLIPYSVIKPGSIDIQLKKRRKRRSRKTTILNDSCTDETAPNNDEQDNKSDSDDIETSKMQITEADMNKHDGLTEAGLETMTQVQTNEDDENSLASGKCQDLGVLVSDCAALRLDLNTSHNDLQKDDADETYYDSNLTLTSQQCNIHFSELHLRMKELEIELPLTTQDLHVTEEYDGKHELAEARFASASVLKIKFHDYDEMSIRKLWLALNSNEYNYSWALHSFTGGLEPMARCTCCGADGHLRENCPELMIPEPKNFAPLTNAQKKIINLVISDIFNTMRIRPYYVHSMSALCRELEGFLRRFYRTDCHLSLFGSAGNGFGLLGSDADICLRFGRGVRPEDIDSAEVICRVADVVRKMPGITFVSEIPHAKVPIVKFRCRNHLEADLSLYNVLALENTRLLRTYSKLDERIHKLGIMTKIWAKSCEIGNASKGSLSSYSYIIMLIHYLQRTNPPVAPFLQEIAPPGRCRKPVIIDDCDVYFCSFEDLEWTVYNRSTIGELWIGFLDYFGTKFDFTQEVVQIRQTQRLMKLDKGWQSRPIAIEDPFDLTHNLSSGVHSKTMAYIHKSFIQSREKFSTVPVPNSKLNHNSLIFYASALLSSCRVGNGPPLDRNCCHRCRKIGHFVMDCPLGMKDKKHNK